MMLSWNYLECGRLPTLTKYGHRTCGNVKSDLSETDQLSIQKPHCINMLELQMCIRAHAEFLEGAIFCWLSSFLLVCCHANSVKTHISIFKLLKYFGGATIYSSYSSRAEIQQRWSNPPCFSTSIRVSLDEFL